MQPRPALVPKFPDEAKLLDTALFSKSSMKHILFKEQVASGSISVRKAFVSPAELDWDSVRQRTNSVTHLLKLPMLMLFSFLSRHSSKA